MSLREAAQQALVCVVCVRDMAVHPDERMRDMAVHPDSVQMFENTITALRTALAEPEQGPVAYVSGVYAGHFTVVPTNPALVLTTGMALYTHPVDDTALLRQCLDVMSIVLDDVDWRPKSPTQKVICKAITALRERLEGKE
jgi:hypothetical protein